MKRLIRWQWGARKVGIAFRVPLPPEEIVRLRAVGGGGPTGIDVMKLSAMDRQLSLAKLQGALGALAGYMTSFRGHCRQGVQATGRTT